MNQPSEVFNKTYEYYTSRIAEIDLAAAAGTLGAGFEDGGLTIPVLGTPFRVSADGIRDTTGQRAPFEICIILSKYVLMCPPYNPRRHDWVSYRDLKESGPLTKYFADNAESAVANRFSGRIEALERAAAALGGRPPDMEISYDVARQFAVLPRVPVLMLFNDAEEGFTASCSVLFERHAESYLDAECLAMIGHMLAERLKKGG